MRRLAALLAAATAVLVLAPSAPAAGQTSTRWGATVQSDGDYQGALRAAEDRYGTYGVVRLFQGPPSTAWQDNAGTRPAIVSFRPPPAEVLAGRWDGPLRTFFREAPTTRPTWWSYFHESDVAAAQHGLDLAQYRAAFRHIVRLSYEARNPQLKVTPIVLCWTAAGGGGRNLVDYLPSVAMTDVVGLDCYNGPATRAGRYGVESTPAQLTEAVRVIRSHGLEFGVAEFGSVLLAGDDGTGRARWLNAMAATTGRLGGQFGAWFDIIGPRGTDYRLTDAPSRQAWRDIVSGAGP